MCLAAVRFTAHYQHTDSIHAAQPAQAHLHFRPAGIAHIVSSVATCEACVSVSAGHTVQDSAGKSQAYQKFLGKADDTASRAAFEYETCSTFTDTSLFRLPTILV